MSAFKIHDLWGIGGAMLLLVLVYLLLSNGTSTLNLTNSLFSGSNTLLKTLQGRS